MPTQPPLILVENFLDDVQQFPSGGILGVGLSASSEVAGHEAYRVADYRRERTWWQPSAAGERANLDMNLNVAGGTDQRMLIGVPGAFNQASQSHVFAFLVQSGAALTGTQVLSHVVGVGASLITYRNTGTPLGFFDGASKTFGAGANAPVDGAYHTLIFTFSSTALIARVYVDGVQVGVDTAYTPRALNAGAAWAFGGHASLFSQAFAGRLGRVAYWNTSLPALTVAQIHTQLINEDRDPAGVIGTTATYEWDPLYGQGTQTLTERKLGVANLTLGRTSGIESSPLYDPAWAGGAWIQTSLATVNNVRPDFIWLDRGHNLWGALVVVDGLQDADDSWTNFTERGLPARQIPALDANGNYVPGGDPTTGWCVTEEGACYALYPAPAVTSTAFRVRFLVSSTSYIPVVPGIMLGRRHQLLNYSTTLDEDAGERTERFEDSDAGYRAFGKMFDGRTVEIGFKYTGLVEYDSTIRDLRRLLFKKNQPFVAAMEYGTYPARAWLYQYSGRTWSMPKSRVYREGRIVGREVGPKVE